MRWRELKTPVEPRSAGESEDAFQERAEREWLRKIDLAFDHFGISRDDPEAHAKLLCEILPRAFSGFRVRRQSGKKARRERTADDLILAYGVSKAKAGSQNVSSTIRALKRHNRWAESVSTLRRRYYELERPNSKERRRMAEMAAWFLPQLLNQKKGAR